MVRTNQNFLDVRAVSSRIVAIPFRVGSFPWQAFGNLLIPFHAN